MTAGSRIRPFECPDCGDIVFSADNGAGCEHTARPIEAVGSAVDSPDLATVLRVVFGMSQTGIEICLCVMEAGEATTVDLAEALDVDRSHVSRHLNHLTELGVLDRRRRVLDQGGYVNVYTPASQAAIRRSFRRGLSRWAADALALVDGLSKDKIEALASQRVIASDPDRPFYPRTRVPDD